MSSEPPASSDSPQPGRPIGDDHADPVEAIIVEPAAPEPISAPLPPPAVMLGDDEGGHYSRLHPSSLVFDLIAHGRSYLFPVALGLWGAAKGDRTMLIISAMIFVPAFLTSVFRYFTYQYRIEKDHLIVRQGLIFRSVRTVPVSRIQNIDFVQNLFHRMINVAEVKIETASGTKPEATMRVLSMTQMESLRNAVFEKQASPQPHVPETPAVTEHTDFPIPSHALNRIGLDGENQTLTGNQPPREECTFGVPASPVASAHSGNRAEETPVTLLEIPTSWLIKAGLASNRGMIIVGILVGATLQFAGASQLISDQFNSLAHGNISIPMLVLFGVAGLIGMLLLLRILGVAWFLLRFHGYQLVRHGDDMRIRCGLLTKVSATVPRQRIQFISIHRNLIMRMIGFSSIRIETAGGAGTQSENATETVSKRWFVPVIPTEQVPGLLAELRPGFEWDESQLEFQPLAAKAGRRLCRLAFVESLVILGVGLAFNLYWGWIAGVVALPLAFMWAIKKSKSMCYAHTDTGVVYRSGVLTRKTSMTFFEKIQTLRVDQSPFDRRWKMAKLRVDTAAAGPADHPISVPYLDEQFAYEELQRLRIKTGQQQPVFG